MAAASYLVADGTFVLQTVGAGAAAPQPRNGTQFWSCPPSGTAYGRIAVPAGLTGDQLNAVQRLPGGGYLAHNVAGAWVSDDGRTWTRLAIR